MVYINLDSCDTGDLMWVVSFCVLDSGIRYSLVVACLHSFLSIPDNGCDRSSSLRHLPRRTVNLEP